MRHAAFILFVLLITTMAGIGQAAAQASSMYFTGYLGLTRFGDRGLTDSSQSVSGVVETNNSLSFAGALGFRLNPQVRIEAELGYSKSDLSNLTVAGTESRIGGETKTYSLMVSGFYDFNVDWPVQPYISAGLGLGIHDGTINGNGVVSTQSGDDWTMLYNVGTGLRYRLANDMALSAGYRYLGSTDIEMGQAELEYNAHELRFGLEYDLPVGWDIGR